MFKKFKELKTGVKRALIAGTLVGAPLIGYLVGYFLEYNHNVDGEEFWGYTIFLGIPIYWVLVFIGIWVYEGFKER